MTVRDDPDLHSGERMYLETSPEATIGEHLARYRFVFDLLRPGVRVVDAACGSGYGAALLSERAGHVVAIDISTHALKWAQTTQFRPNVSLIRADLAGTIPVLTNSVDVAVSFETLEHIQAKSRFLQELHRIVRPGGRLIVSTPDRDVYSSLIGYKNSHHKRELSRSEFVELVTEHFGEVQLFGQVQWKGNNWVAMARRAVRPLLPAHTRDALKRALEHFVNLERYGYSDFSVRPIRGNTGELYFYLMAIGRKQAP